MEVRASGDDASDEAKVNMEIKQMLKQKGVNRVVGHRGTVPQPPAGLYSVLL